MEYAGQEMGTGTLIVQLIVMVIGYVYLALVLQKLSQRTGRGTPWWGWVPILNVLLMLEVADKPLWWFILMLIPIVNIVIAVIVWMKIAEAVNKPNWWGILILVPIVNVIVPGYLAWSGDSGPPATS